MFKHKYLRQKVETLEKEIDILRTERLDLKDEVEDLKLKKKVSEEDMKHLVRMKEEKNEIERQKRINEIEIEKNNEVAAVKDGYRDKMEKQLERETQNIKEMYNEILKRLPNVNVKMTGEL